MLLLLLFWDLYYIKDIGFQNKCIINSRTKELYGNLLSINESLCDFLVLESCYFSWEIGKRVRTLMYECRD